MKQNKIIISSIVLAFVLCSCSLVKKDLQPEVIVIPINPDNPIEIVVDPNKPAPTIIVEDKIPVVIKGGQSYRFDGYAITNIVFMQLIDGDWSKEFKIVKQGEIAPSTCYLLSEKILLIDKDKGIKLKDSIK